MMTHTLGPWERRDIPGYNDTEIWADKTLVAKVRDGDFDGPLIAAAPDLLAALQKLVEHAEESILNGWRIPEVFDDARAAISKATGRDLAKRQT